MGKTNMKLSILFQAALGYNYGLNRFGYNGFSHGFGLARDHQISSVAATAMLEHVARKARMVEAAEEVDAMTGGAVGNAGHERGVQNMDEFLSEAERKKKKKDDKKKKKDEKKKKKIKRRKIRKTRKRKKLIRRTKKAKRTKVRWTINFQNQSSYCINHVSCPQIIIK